MVIVRFVDFLQCLAREPVLQAEVGEILERRHLMLLFVLPQSVHHLELALLQRDVLQLGLQAHHGRAANLLDLALSSTLLGQYFDGVE